MASAYDLPYATYGDEYPGDEYTVMQIYKSVFCQVGGHESIFTA